MNINNTISNGNLYIENNIHFYITIDSENLNLIDFDEGVPIEFRGFGLGYKLYKLIISKFKYITANKHSSKFAYNIWYNLMLDNDLYCCYSNS